MPSAILDMQSPKPRSVPPRTLRAACLVAAASLLLVASCRPRAAQVSVTEISASPTATKPTTVQERVEIITKQLSRNGKLPGVLLDAQFLQEKVGDGVLGPSDYFAFYALTVPVADLPAWRAALAAAPVVKGAPGYAAPKAPTPWWLQPAEFGKLELFDSKPLTGNVNGWVGLAPDGRIFIYAFTI